ncbi:MAG: serine hydrolase [Pirellulales bacterium]|nr:serine hydrolase [Pirellulales bacterium]
MLGATLELPAGLDRRNQEIARLDLGVIARMAERLFGAWEQDRCVCICGNGGSAATAAQMSLVCNICLPSFVGNVLVDRCAVVARTVAMVLAVLAILLLPSCGFAVEPASQDAGLQEMLADVCRKHKVPSLTIAVVRSAGTVTMQCSGVRKRRTDESVELSDRHPLGSCTKSMTATLAAVLVEAGKIGWDTTIGQVWSRAGEKHLHAALRDVTLDELLSHQSGLASDLKDFQTIKADEWLSFFEEQASPQLERRRMLGLILAIKPQHPRGSYHYSNLGYVVAAAMLETKGGDSFENLMRRHVFQPLTMDTADFRTLALAKELKPPLLWGHVADGSPIDPRIAGAENPSVYAACGTVHLSIADYARYAQWHLKHEPAPLLSQQENVEHLHVGKVDAPAERGKYGCGWIVLDSALGRALFHGGSNTNSQALIWLLPERDFAAVACTNTGESSGLSACGEAIQELMKRYAQAPSKD